MDKNENEAPMNALQAAAQAGGRARAASLSSDQRSKIAKKAAKARWGSKKKKPARTKKAKAAKVNG